MSDPKLRCPMLEHYTMGEAISGHNGVVCYPAMRENSEDRYIVKIISLPASPVQRTALLLSGAYATEEEVLHYYRSLAEEILQEVRWINELGALEGFVPFLEGQILEKENGEGYEVCLLSPYQTSLEQIFNEEVMTHRGIMDLAMDLCSALASCRRAGYLYTDLKPSNIFHDDTYGYRISDLGLLRLSSLKYASLPEKYQSLYTAPEVTDASSQLNETLDVYALGLVLYQAYNGGILPVEDGKPGPLLPPEYADYEMAEIILRACHPDPEKRWKDPMALGHALGLYMQNNPVEDTPIVPPPVSTPELDAGEDFLPEEEMSEEDFDSIPELTFWQELEQEDSAQLAENEDSIEMTDEDTSAILAHADELIAHALPDPVVPPEMIDIPMPQPIEAEAPAEEPIVEPEAPIQEEQPTEAAPVAVETVPQSAPQANVPPAPAAKQDTPTVKEHKPAPKWILPLIAVILLAALAFGAVYYYQNIYLQHIDGLSIVGGDTSLTVQVQSQIPDERLFVTCSDTYGNTLTARVENGEATFTGLAPQTRYTVRVGMDGFHKLTGVLTDSYTTPNQTNILSFSASIGPVDGSVYLNFTVNGTESDDWIITYRADGIAEQSVSFAGHSITIYDLMIGADYTFTLSAGDTANITGNTQVSFTARTIIRAENAMISACGNGSLTVQWDTPAGEAVSGWTVHCYDSSGFDQTVTTTENTVTFTGLSHETPCSVEILAEGMNQGVTVQIGANPINITGFSYDTNPLYGLSLSWTFEGAEPEAEWMLYWSCDGYSSGVITSAEENAYLPYIPNGKYTVSLALQDGTTVFGHSYEFTLSEAEMFSGFGLTLQNMNFMMCATPGYDDWQWDDVHQDDYRTDFLSGERGGLIIWTDTQPEASAESVQILFVVRDSEGNVVHVGTQQQIWDEMWDQNYAELTLPFTPSQPGTYTVWVYFNHLYATEHSFIIQ